jgi:hypothetical protein
MSQSSRRDMTSPPMTNREYAYLAITGGGSHQEITKIIGIEPSLAWNVGDKSEATGKVQKFMRWRKDSGLDDTEPVDKHIENILTLFVSRKQKEIQELFFKGYDVYIACAGWYPASGHGVHLSREIIREAGKANISIDLDFYYVDSEGHDG